MTEKLQETKPTEQKVNIKQLALLNKFSEVKYQMSKPLFIVTMDEETANQFVKAGFAQLQNTGKKKVFLNNDKLNFAGIDRTKFTYTNIMQI